MKITFVVDDYAGGAGNIVQLLATEYAKTDDVSVLLTNQKSEKRYECKNVNFFELTADEKPKGALNVVKYQAKWIKSKLKVIEPDVVISFLTLNTVFTVLGRLPKQLPLVACERICPSDLNLKFPWNALMRISYRRADALTVQFKEFVSLYGGRYTEKCFVTPNYIAKPDRFWNERNEAVTRFISCGRLNASKQFDLLIDMFAEIHKSNPKTELFIYGRGPHEERLKKQIADAGLSDAVFLKGYTNDTYGVLCDADIYLMSSKSEGFPNALSEAMAVGMPSIAFRCNKGIDELADYGRRGKVVDANDKEAFVAAALELCGDREQRAEYSKNAKEVFEVYSLDKVKKTWDECIEKAIAHRKRR